MINLDMLAADIASVLDERYGLHDVGASDVRRGLVPFLEAIAPGALTEAQRFGGKLVQKWIKVPDLIQAGGKDAMLAWAEAYASSHGWESFHHPARRATPTQLRFYRWDQPGA